MTSASSQALLPAPVEVSQQVPALLAPDLAQTATLARQEKSSSTRPRGVSPLPAMPEIIAGFLASEAERGIRPSTIGRRVAAIRYAHKLAGHASPTDGKTLPALGWHRLGFLQRSAQRP
jgi:hypothetical protein